MKAKKVMALMLCAAMVTSMSATAAFAAEEKEDAATEECQHQALWQLICRNSSKI